MYKASAYYALEKKEKLPKEKEKPLGKTKKRAIDAGNYYRSYSEISLDFK